MTGDPAGWGRNWYQYARNNPITYPDAFGLKLTLVIIIAELGDFRENDGKTGDDLRDHSNALLMRIYDYYKGDYGIQFKKVRSRHDAIQAMTSYDAAVIIGHSSPVIIPNAYGGMNKAFLNDVAVQRGERMRFVRIYSCGTLATDKEIRQWLDIPDDLFGSPGSCYPAVNGRKGLDYAGTWYNGIWYFRMHGGSPIIFPP